MSKKKVVHIWKGQEGTWFSQMDKGFNVNCEKCLAVYDFERLKKITGASVEYPDYETLKQQRDDLLEALKRAYFLLETNRIEDEYFEVLRLKLGDLLPSQIVSEEMVVAAIAKCEA